MQSCRSNAASLKRRPSRRACSAISARSSASGLLPGVLIVDGLLVHLPIVGLVPVRPLLAVPGEVLGGVLLRLHLPGFLVVGLEFSLSGGPHSLAVGFGVCDEFLLVHVLEHAQARHGLAGMLLLPFVLPALILKYLRAHRLLCLLRKGFPCHGGIACLLVGPVLGLLLLGRSQLLLPGPPRAALAAAGRAPVQVLQR